MHDASDKWYLFDKRDHDLITIVNSVYDAENGLGYTRRLYYTYFHPLGIKELAESRGLRTAYSIANLLESMERGGIENRIQALNGLKDDVLATADGPVPRNTARVLLQIMKEMVRAKGLYRRQLELAHDFRVAAFGKPRVIRRLLARYHLFEMPEAWNQISFDDHVHDANTSGRKSPTHLIMDAWIKGIRRLRVIYYHYIEPRFASELIQAAKIMDIDLRIGIEFRARYRNKYVSLIWVSRGLTDVESFLCFLAEPRVVRFMEEGKAVLRFKERYVLNLLEEFNSQHLEAMCREFGIQLPALCPKAFLDFVFPGQASAVYLAEYIHWLALEQMKETISLWQKAPPKDEKESDARALLVKKMEGFGVGQILSQYLESSRYFDIFQHAIICSDTEIPTRLKLGFNQMIEEIGQLHHSFRITLNLGNLKPEDVLELLYEGDGVITRLETINLKNFVDRNTEHIIAINELQQAINNGSLLKLKRVVRQIIEKVKTSDHRGQEDRLQKLTDILYDIDSLKNMYAARPLKSRIGSDSTGKPNQGYGMGFALMTTLPARAVTKIRKEVEKLHILPARIEVCRRTTTVPGERASWARFLPGSELLLQRKKIDWVFHSFTLDMKQAGNIVSLGHVMLRTKNKLDLGEAGPRPAASEKSWTYMNSKLKNSLKILFGFVPAFLCFFLTKDWWLLAYLGAFIWFGITGLRNILQSVIGGGGIRRTSFLKWNDFVSWDRFSDSLLFTGFSVPLLDYIIKTLLLERTLNITMATSPTLVYSVMALANGIYLSSHNIFRGLPRAAAAGNFFRSVFSIPVAIAVSGGIGGILHMIGVPGVNDILQKWAAIISKAASDSVAGLIEGSAERFHNVKLRKRDTRMKFKDLFKTYAKLARLFPEKEELRILDRPAELFDNKNSEVRDLTVLIIINSLDLLYFWMYLPRARAVMVTMIERLTPEEKTIFLQSQHLLTQERYISRLFIDGILGSNFSRPLSFYLSNSRAYLAGLSSIQT